MKFPHLPKFTFTGIILVFLMPFVLVKCNNVQIAKITGIELVTGTEITPYDGDKEESLVDMDEEAQKVEPNVFVIAALVLAVVGLVLAFVKGTAVISLIVSILGLLALVLFYFDIQGESSDTKFITLVITVGTGYYLALAGYVINIVFFGAGLKKPAPPVPGNEPEAGNPA